MNDILKSLWLDARPWLTALLVGLVLGAMCSSCRTSRPPTPAVTAEAIGATAAADTAAARPLAALPVRPDSVRVNPARWLVDKIRGKDRSGKTYVRPTSVTVSGKKSTVTVYEGPATVTTVGKKATAAAGAGATVVQSSKKAGAVVVADSGATVQVATSKKGPAAAAGRDANATQLKPAGTSWQVWVMRGVIAAVAGAALWFGWPLLVAWWSRRKNNTTA